MKKSWRRIVIVVTVAAMLCLGAAALAAGNAGSVDDPLVTLSYLNQIFAPRMNEAVDKAVAAGQASLKAELDGAIDRWTKTIGGAGSAGGSSATFSVVTLKQGQVLTGDVGCEVMLRIGTATCVFSGTTGIIDTTSGGTLNNGGSLVTNHLYMVTIATRGVKATSNTVKVLVRGNYTIA